MIHSRFGPSNVIVGAFTPKLPSSRVGGKARAPSASRRSWGSGNQMSGSPVRFIRLRGGESPAEKDLPGIYYLVSYGVPSFNVPSESELAAEFDAHPNREEMINAAENECEAGIQPEGRLLVALHNYKSAWSRLTNDSSTPQALVMPEERREKREKREERREKRDEIASQESIAHF